VTVAYAFDNLAKLAPASMRFSGLTVSIDDAQIQRRSHFRRICLTKLERKQVEEALRQSEARFQVLVSNMPGMVYRYTPHADGGAALLSSANDHLSIYRGVPDAASK
jgi:PAS domain-containing protein